MTSTTRNDGEEKRLTVEALILINPSSFALWQGKIFPSFSLLPNPPNIDDGLSFTGDFIAHSATSPTRAGRKAGVPSANRTTREW